jgi:hypothetical protein
MPDVGQIFKEERESADARGRKGRARQKKRRYHAQLQCRNNGWVVMHEADLTKGRCGGAADTPRLFGSSGASPLLLLHQRHASQGQTTVRKHSTCKHTLLEIYHPKALHFSSYRHNYIHHQIYYTDDPLHATQNNPILGAFNKKKATCIMCCALCWH